MFKAVSLIVCLILGVNTVKSQTDVSIHFGGAFPLGAFGDQKLDFDRGLFDISWGGEKNTDKAGAGLGANVGLKLKFNTPSLLQGLGIIATADVFFNPSNSEVKDFMEDVCEAARTGDYSYYDYEYTAPSYINIPIMVGMNYQTQVADKVSLFAEAAVGVNIGKTTDLHLFQEIEGTIEQYDPYYDWYDYYDCSVESNSTWTFETTTSLAFQVGAGLMLSDKFSIGLHYYSLGSQKVKGESKWDRTQTIEGDTDYDNESGKFKYGSIKPAMFTLRLGFHF